MASPVAQLGLAVAKGVCNALAHWQGKLEVQAKQLKCEADSGSAISIASSVVFCFVIFD